MVLAAPHSFRPLPRLLLAAMLALALASRLALGASVPAHGPAGGIALSGIARLQAAMIMCEPGETSQVPPPPSRQKTSFDDLLLWAQADATHALAVAPTPLPLMTAPWIIADFLPTARADTPMLHRPMPQPRGPPAAL